jgi:hypothetical protein
LVVPPEFVKTGEIAPSVYPERGVWTVIIHEAKGLPNIRGSHADGYVRIYGQLSMDTPKLQEGITETVKNSANPVFQYAVHSHHPLPYTDSYPTIPLL